MSTAAESSINDRAASAVAMSFAIATALATLLYLGVMGVLASIERLSPGIHFFLLLCPAPVCGALGYWLLRKSRLPAKGILTAVVLTTLVAPFIGLSLVYYGGLLWAILSGKGL